MPAYLASLNPGWLLIVAGVIALFVKVRVVRQAISIIAPVIGILMLATAQHGVDHMTYETLGIKLSFYRVDSLNFLFGLAFLIAALLNAIYALHTDNKTQDGMALAYAGSAIAATFAGDLMTLFIFWEITAITSVFMVLQAGTRASYFASMRYLGIQILSGVLLLDGIAYVWHYQGDLSLQAFSDLNQPGALIIFIAFGIKAAFPFLHNWLQDAYPKATVTGAVVLSAFTTKLAVYAFARLFPGQHELIWIGAVMTCFPVFFAVIENDLRKVLAYSTNNQVGFMICAIGVGTPLALNGAVAHAFADILFKGLLFMSMGAVLYRTGTTKANELGGLYRSMPWTTLFCLVGAISISAMPLFSAFVTKSMILSSVASTGMVVVWLMLMFASAGVLEHSGIKIPYFAFFGHDSGKRVKEAPFNMLLAMGMAAFLCIAIGLPAFLPGFGYEWLYSLLPYPIEAASYQPFTLGHILAQLQLLALAVFAFVLLQRLGLYPPEKPGVILDTDWLYRKAGYGTARWIDTVWAKLGPAMTATFRTLSERAYDRLVDTFSPRGVLARNGVSGGMAVWTTVILGVVLLVSYLTS
ncbi:MAG: Na(+)/H(+) antiporter subunit D [Hyphomonas sp.]|uniref:Na(+)/H(+) antiporter subunit D n=1 Tax=Hyphomonas sp. TaxID=87 RepID=UPI0017F78786|nr:Na(+)/H(+) antiporter subunit D [Hyphomonas sp.]MBA3067726.1 Na(+)/H(+) antiporter subunit D [Hyphomonas sp.]MBU3921978.1 Na(+)/H(+) antiporter subunit D [Alphaproteobacteria bacterium]MBU4062186.1 Na(+)/H(+) antiporter subunit D [Alphaproteobacteria bacterium]MBU4165621.1 Na(+)/H(+) antiporter subunit D [Alphaproteobacteria bacterium]